MADSCYITSGRTNKKHLSFRIHGSICWSLVSTETCSVTSWFPRIHLHGNVFVNAFPSNGSTSHNTINSTTRDNHNATTKKGFVIVYLSWYRYGLGAGVRFPAGTRDSLFPTASRSVLGPPSLLSNGHMWLFPLEVKRQGREADHSPPCSTQGKNKWNYTFTSQ
jgi:hypothetical protein